MKLIVTDLRSGYGDLTVVRGAAFEVKPGEIVAVLGHNGVGKTTLLKTLIGLLRPRAGRVTLAGVDLTSLPPYRVAALGVADIPQDAALFPDLSVAQNLGVAIAKRRDFQAACEPALAAFPFLRERLRQRAGTLSGGEQKMLLVARALVVSPRLILADEVTEGVQPMQVARIGDTLRDINARDGASILLVEQHIDFALTLASRYLVMKQGRIVASGETGLSGTKERIENQLRL
jgi:urea transport system ATP-binding protein